MTASPCDVAQKPAQKGHVEALQDLLVRPVLLVSCLWGTKKCFGRWGETTIESMADPKYLARLAKGNIGVALGDRSGRLCTIDIDADDEVEPFLELNPVFEETLMSRGKRGCNLWFRLRENCPPSRPLKRHGKPWGEFRANGNQTIIYGQHPEGMRYTIPQRFHPVVIGFSNIRWPEGMNATRPPRVSHRTDETEATDDSYDTHGTDETQEIRVVAGCVLVGSPLPQEVIERTLPTRSHENHECLFRLAREVRSFENKHGGNIDLPGLRSIVAEWLSGAKSHLRAEQTADEYFMEFMSGYRRVKYLIGEQVLLKAWDRAMASEPPVEITQLCVQAEIRNLACLCRELQREFGDQPFFLSCRKVGELFGVQYSTASLWLRGLEACGIIKTAEKGGPHSNKASRFRYLLPLD